MSATKRQKAKEATYRYRSSLIAYKVKVKCKMQMLTVGKLTTYQEVINIYKI